MASICCSPPDSVPARWRAALVEAREDREHTLAVGRAALGGAAIAAEVEIVAHRQVRKDAPALRHMDKPARDDRRRLVALDGDAVEQDRAAARAHNAGNGAVERRLADAVRTEHGDDLARLDSQIDAAQHVSVAVAGAERAHLEERLSGHERLPTFAAAPRPR